VVVKDAVAEPKITQEETGDGVELSLKLSLRWGQTSDVSALLLKISSLGKWLGA
jgi:hypothetical protein